MAVDPATSNGATQRTAILHLPATITPGDPAPVVLEFHGAGPGATAAGYEQGSPLRRISDTAGFIDVFPQGLRMPNGNLGWNAYGPVLIKVAELPFVESVVQTVERDYCVDPSRVYASGASNGANMVNYLACRDAGIFAAVAPVVGPMFGQDDGPCRPQRAVPIIDLHSPNDPAVPYGGHGGPPRYDFPLPSVPSWLAGWATLDGCPPPKPATTSPGNVSRQEWSGCRDGARIVAYATTSGHAWPSELDGKPAAEQVWAFLSSFHLPT